MRASRLRSQALAAFAAASLFAVGCGGSDEEDIKDAIKEIAAAAKDKDYGKVCDGFTDKVRKQFESRGRQTGGGDCAKFLQKLDKAGASKRIGAPDNVEFEKVTVKGDSATVKIKDQPQPTKLVKEDGDWKVGLE